MPKERLATHVFDLPVQELRRGYRSDIYFWRSKVALEKRGHHPKVTMQYFQKKGGLLCGMDEAIAVLRVAAGRYRDTERAYKLFDRLMELKRAARERFLDDRPGYVEVIREHMDLSEELDELWEPGFDALEIDALHDGDHVRPRDSVMHVRGDYSLFAHLETITLGIMARRTRIATNVHRVVSAARDKPILFFPARFDHWAVQGGDGYAAHIGGAAGISTDAQGEWWGAKAAGTVPHALIAAMAGSTVEAVKIFDEAYPDVRLIALVDFHNDSVETSLECARAMGERLWGVRLDTSESMVDRAVMPLMGGFKPTGVNPPLARATRRALDEEGFEHVKIVCSGGFDEEKIAHFEREGVPVDAYGVGSALMRNPIDFTADVVELEGRHMAKAGRRFNPLPSPQERKGAS